MERRSTRRRRTGVAWGVGLGLALASAFGPGSSSARAQTAADLSGVPDAVNGQGQSLRGNPSMFANPYMNPYLNPFLTPSAATQQMPPGDAALFYFAAQSAMGGIGSGRLGGPKAGQAHAAASKPKELAARGSANTPGAGAARYFNRNFPITPAPVRASTNPSARYNRQTRYFPSNDR